MDEMSTPKAIYFCDDRLIQIVDVIQLTRRLCDLSYFLEFSYR